MTKSKQSILTSVVAILLLFGIAAGVVACSDIMTPVGSGGSGDASNVPTGTETSGKGSTDSDKSDVTKLEKVPISDKDVLVCSFGSSSDMTHTVRYNSDKKLGYYAIRVKGLNPNTEYRVKWKLKSGFQIATDAYFEQIDMNGDTYPVIRLRYDEYGTGDIGRRHYAPNGTEAELMEGYIDFKIPSEGFVFEFQPFWFNASDSATAAAFMDKLRPYVETLEIYALGD